MFEEIPFTDVFLAALTPKRIAPSFSLIFSFDIETQLFRSSFVLERCFPEHVLIPDELEVNLANFLDLK